MGLGCDTVVVGAVFLLLQGLRLVEGASQVAGGTSGESLCYTLLYCLASLGFRDTLSKIAETEAQRIPTSGIRACTQMGPGLVAGNCSKGTVIVRTLADFMRQAVPFRGDFEELARKKASELSLGRMACPRHFGAAQALFFVGRRLQRLPPRGRSVLQDVMVSWALTFDQVQWLGRTRDSSAEVPAALTLTALLAAQPAQAVSAAQVTDGAVLQLNRLLARDERADLEWTRALAVGGCSILGLTAAIAHIEAWKDAEEVPDNVQRMLTDAAACLQALVAERGGPGLLEEIRRSGLAFPAWHVRLTATPAVRLTAPTGWRPYVATSPSGEGAEDAGEGPRQRLLLERDYESIFVRAEREPFCSFATRRHLRTAIAAGVRTVVDIGAYVGGCSLWTLASYAHTHAVALEPFGPAYRVMSKDAEAWEGRWQTVEACVGNATLGLKPPVDGMALQLPHWRADADVVEPAGISAEEEGDASQPPAGYLWRHAWDYLPRRCQGLDEFAAVWQAPGPVVLRIHTHLGALDALLTAAALFRANRIGAAIVEVFPGNAARVGEVLQDAGCSVDPKTMETPSNVAQKNTWTVFAQCRVGSPPAETSS
eukprot:TRINITY_DN16771_c0_g1_i1.p1 TRINITY_DN16771_c0_g1~~TRINITY_DN16771_c0_g1_i1.p1  ORF type:complete len:597 (-),score=118.20 TRINITY_DN16771_c0_g1_i1:85-1875(-)